MAKCKIVDCVAPLSCHEHGGDYLQCEHWRANNSPANDKGSKAGKEIKPNLTWTGDSLKVSGINSVSSRSEPTIIGIVGKVDAGKTSFLGMLYTLLLNGRKLSNYDFVGSKTIIGWDELHFDLTIQKGQVKFPDPTAPGVNRLFHLALRNEDGQLKDILFSDASGETFWHWSQDRDDVSAANARWIHENSSGFILFIDCDALIKEMSSAKNEIIDIAQQLSCFLYDRPVIAVWSKSDKKGDVNEKIILALKERLSSLFTNFKEIEISNLLVPGPEELVQKHNLQAIDWLLDKIMNRGANEPLVNRIQTNDFFLNYRGR
jgi:hypothetical protein